MKRLNSSDSLGALMTVCSSQEKNLEQLNNNSNNSNVYSRGFQSMLEGLDEEDVMEESGHVSEKKRRLSVDQVKALEKNFEVENKLEPERKVKLAQELGLQPRQVAVWFQNRRARWKTKQLERDYGVLKANYDTLKLNFESLQKEKESIVSELKELKSKVQDGDGDGDGDGDEDGNTRSEELYIKKEMIAVSESLMVTEHNEIPTTNSPIQNNGAAVPVFGDYKDGSSDSDSSAILNDENNNNNNNNSSSPNAGMCSSEVLNHQHLSNMSPASSSLGGFNGSSSSPSQSSINCFPFTDTRSITQKAFQHQQFARMEEHNFFGAEETCNFFSDDQAPTLQWYYSTDQWT